MSFITAIMPESIVEREQDSRLQALQGENFIPTTGDVIGTQVDAFLTQDGLTKKGIDFLRMKFDDTAPISREQYATHPRARPDIEYFDGMTEGQLAITEKRHRIKEENDFVWERASGLQKTTGFISGMAAGFADPVQIPFMFLKVPYATAAIATKVEAGVLSKTAGRALTGAAEGAVGTAYTEPFNAYFSNQLKEDYTMADALASVAFGGFVGSGLHVGFGKIGDIWDHGINGKTHGEASQTAIGQVLSGKTVDVDPIIEVGRFENARHMIDKQEADLRRGNLDHWKAAEDFQLGEIRGQGKVAKYADYTRPRLADRQWLQGLKYELNTTEGGTRYFREVDGQGSTAEVGGYKGTTPEWFTQHNKQVDVANRTRKKVKKQVNAGRIDAKDLPASRSILTREKANRVIDKLLSGKPLGKAEGDIAQTIMAEARGRRTKNVEQMLDVRAQREAHAKLAPEMKAYTDKEGAAWFGRQKSYESDSTYNPEHSKQIDAIANEPDPFDPNGWETESMEIEAELAEMDAMGYLDPEEKVMLDSLKADEAEAKSMGEAYRAASFCMTKNGA